ncbi:esterase/lipase family protein [Kribbella shirazensis]|uniref:Pimeloyl-ACP methyl ester carboxylesterase n=1 Tax=Kribbella shirazensis TaxID=1105143 RepID=A0A7X6A6I5_9ACTN|nr:alpha/beta fold hydrolase [Kribbella shirazensis]NIK62374.1 pimeloyl-ACP methyl ester carboxylesterase [Kribbella shirazensis]
MGSWQDEVRGALDGLAYGARSALTPRVLHGAAVEIGWLTTHLAMYPLGLVAGSSPALPERLNLTGLGPAQRGLLVNDVRAAGTPILLAHGIIDNHTIFALMRRQLVRRGFGAIHTFSYSPLTLDVRRTAERMGREIEAICEASGSDQIHVIGHSLGGLIARYYVQRLGGDARVHTCVTLGTPHQGTVAAKLLPWPLVKQLRPDSDVMAELDEPAPDCRTRFVAFYSDVDQLIVPQRRARIRHPDLLASNVRVRGVGHLSLPFHGEVVHRITGVLANLDDEEPRTA